MGELKLQMNMDEYLPLRDVVFNTLRQGILTGELKPGERLMEIHLADRLGVSRTPIREAIRMLELEGLVTMIPRRGAEVARISRQDIRDVLEVRLVLDSLATKLACERITEDQKEELRSAAAGFESATGSGDVTLIAQADVRFHDVILAASHNRRLIQMVNNLAERIYRYRLEYIKDSANYQRLIEEHSKIMDCVINGDEGSACIAAEIHIVNQEKVMLNM
ncbi:MAG: GntR family transcriptional regulator [Lachnospiraceae bacterium]|nr:GntR family transcriptional regulator [Lachnospiraceae bacterium]